MSLSELALALELAISQECVSKLRSLYNWCVCLCPKSVVLVSQSVSVCPCVCAWSDICNNFFYCGVARHCRVWPRGDKQPDPTPTQPQPLIFIAYSIIRLSVYIVRILILCSVHCFSYFPHFANPKPQSKYWEMLYCPLLFFVFAFFFVLCGCVVSYSFM